MKLNILIGGKAGQGINKVTEIVSNVLGKYGYFTFNYRDYQSLIRGGHNFNVLSISNEPIESHEAKIDVLVHPSPNEGGPITVLEALAAKRIVLAPDVGIVTQVLKNEENGIIINNTVTNTLYDNMEHIINNYEHFVYLTKNTTKYLKPFSKDVFIHNFYEKLEIISLKCY